MASPLLEAYRRNLAAQGAVDDRTDYQLIRETLGPFAEANPELFDQDPEFARQYREIREANAPSLAGEVGRGLKRGSLGLLSTGLGGASLLTGDGWLREQARRFEKQAASPELAPTVPSLEGVAPGEPSTTRRVLSKDALRYAAGKFGEAAPSLAEGVAAGVAGAAAGSALVPGLGTAAGAVEGFLERGIIRKAIRELVAQGAKKGVTLTEGGVAAALRAGEPAMAAAVTQTAKSIAAGYGAGTAALVNSYILNAGDVLSDIPDRPGLAAAMGVITALPDTVLPAVIARKLFPGVAIGAAKEATKELVANRALDLAKKIGIGLGTVGWEGATEYFQEATNVIARNIRDGLDPLTFTDADAKRFREAGITGMAGGVLGAPAVAMEARQDTVRPGQPPPEPPPVAAAPPPPVVPPAASAPPPQRTTAQIGAAVTAMSDAQKLARIAELDAKGALADDEQAELDLLRATGPTITQPLTPNANTIQSPVAQAGGRPQAAPTPAPLAGGIPGQVQPVAGASVESPPGAQPPQEPPVPIGLRPAKVSTGTGIPTPFEQRMLAEQQRLVDEHLQRQPPAPKIETPRGPEIIPATLLRAGTRELPEPPTGAPPAIGLSGQEIEEGAPPTAELVVPESAPEQFSRSQITAQRKLVNELRTKAEKAAKTSKRRAQRFAQQADEAQARLANMEANRRTGRGPQLGPGPNGEPDLLNAIADNVGLIRLNSEGERGGGEYDDITAALNVGAARLLRSSTKGSAPDQALQELEVSGYRFGSVGELAAAIQAAAEKRKQMGSGLDVIKYRQRVEQAATANLNRPAKLTPESGTPIEAAGVGATFNIHGEKFSIVDVLDTPNDEGRYIFVVQDGHRFEMPEGELLFPDKGTLQKGTPGDPFAGWEVGAQPEATPEILSRPEIEDLRGRKVRLPALTPDGTSVEAEMDAAEAWADTQQRRKVLGMLLDCLKGA